MSFDVFYHGVHHHSFGEYYLLFPTTLSKSKFSVNAGTRWWMVRTFRRDITCHVTSEGLHPLAIFSTFSLVNHATSQDKKKQKVTEDSGNPLPNPSIDASNLYLPQKKAGGTADGSEIRRSPVDKSKYVRDLQGFCMF